MDRRIIDNYNCCIGHMCIDSNCEERLKLPDSACRNSWKVGQRVIESDCQLSGLKFCQCCLLGPVSFNVRLGMCFKYNFVYSVQIVFIPQL